MLEFHKLTAKQIDALPRERTVFLFSTGTIEDYGPYLPAGLAVAEAGELARLVAARLEREKPDWTAVLMPAAPFGVEGDTTALALTVRPHVLRDWLVDSCRSLLRAGFVHFACFSGQLAPRQLTAIEDAGKIIRARSRWRRLKAKVGPVKASPSLVSASSALVTPADVRRAPLWPEPEEHGGARDTSVALALAPDLVDPTYSAAVPQSPPDRGLALALKRRRHAVSGYWGNPAAASPAAGREALDERVERLYPKLRAVWEGADSDSLFRSWYSILPPNRSFFMAWLLTAGILILLIGWAYVTVQTLSSQ